MRAPWLAALAGLTLAFQSAMTDAYAADEDKYFPETADPYMGNWQGRWNAEEDVDPDLAANVYPVSGGAYRIVLKAKHDMRCPPKLDITVKPAGGKLTIDDRTWFGEISGDKFIGGRGDKARFEMRRVELASPTLGLKAPATATVLFDGSNLDAWKSGNDKKPEAGWTLMGDGSMMVKPGTGDLETKQHFGSCRLHIEFRTPLMAAATGQARANSGVFLQGVYEIQVLDSYGLEGYYDECGGLYKLSAPLVNACRPPGQWQTYDIDYAAPQFAGDGKLAAFGRMTVHHNGVLIQDDVELKWITAWKEVERLAPPPSKPGPIRLQDHGNYVQFRNIWIEARD